MSQYNLYTTQKRHNSTLIPTGGVPGEMVLKAGTSLTKPVFLLYFATKPTASMVGFEGRYYFVDDIVSIRNGLWELHCTVDTLATYKSDILATNSFVMYDTTANTEIIDQRLSTKTTPQFAVNTAAFTKLGAVSSAGRGTVLLGVTTDDGVVYYAMSVSDAAGILNRINTVEIPNKVPVTQIGDFTTVEDGIDYIANMFSQGCTQFFASGSASNCIISAREIALPLSAFYGNAQTVYLGSWNSGKQGKAITGRRVDVDLADITIPWTFNDWRRNSPYTEHYFFNEFIGLIKLPESEIIGKNTINVETYYDMISGDIVSILTASDGTTRTRIGTYTGSIACEFSIGSSNVPLTKSLGSIAAGAGATAAALGTAGLSAAVMATGVGAGAITGISGVMSPIPTSVTGGGGGASLALRGDCYVFEITHDTNVQPGSVSGFMGTPSMEVKQLSNLSGYVQTKGFSVSGDMTDWERMEINRLMDGGVYIE